MQVVETIVRPPYEVLPNHSCPVAITDGIGAPTPTPEI